MIKFTIRNYTFRTIILLFKLYNIINILRKFNKKQKTYLKLIG